MRLKRWFSPTPPVKGHETEAGSFRTAMAMPFLLERYDQIAPKHQVRIAF